MAIYDKYIKAGAACEINIDGTTRQNIEDGLATPTQSLFAAAMDQVTKLMERGSFTRYSDC